MIDLLARMLAKDPNHRHQDAGELLGEILLLAEEQQVALNSVRNGNLVVQRPVIQETGWRRHIPWAIPLAVLVGTAMALHFMKVDPTPPPKIGTADDLTKVDEDVDLSSVSPSPTGGAATTETEGIRDAAGSFQDIPEAIAPLE